MKHTILFIAANPPSTPGLDLKREAQEIQTEIAGGKISDRFELVTRWAAQPLDLLRELRRLKPTIVHFSGHGNQHNLFFEGEGGRLRPVSTMALKAAFGATANSVRLVILSACYSESHAQALLEHVECVVGIRDLIVDDAARSFAIGFYGALADDES